MLRNKERSLIRQGHQGEHLVQDTRTKTLTPTLSLEGRGQGEGMRRYSTLMQPESPLAPAALATQADVAAGKAGVCQQGHDKTQAEQTEEPGEVELAGR
jgi:hypothetical protein